MLYIRGRSPTTPRLLKTMSNTKAIQIQSQPAITGLSYAHKVPCRQHIEQVCRGLLSRDLCCHRLCDVEAMQLGSNAGRILKGLPVIAGLDPEGLVKGKVDHQRFAAAGRAMLRVLEDLEVRIVHAAQPLACVPKVPAGQKLFQHCLSHLVRDQSGLLSCSLDASFLETRGLFRALPSKSSKFSCCT